MATVERILIVGGGIRSTVRALAIGGPPPGYAGQVVWRSVVPSRPCGADELTVVLGEGCFFGFVPVGGGRTYGFGGLHASAPSEDPLEGRLERVRRRFAHLGGRSRTTSPPSSAMNSSATT